tara:strand:- start:6 stop:470 length:465 start_codon:yes stop_codon:yes gene_type:complete
MYYKTLVIKKVLILNGPNLNLLSEREQSQYGKISLEEIEKDCLKTSKDLDIELEFKQSNVEGEIINILQNIRKTHNGLIINAAGFTHTSVSIRDTLSILKIPIIEIHISNIYNREEFRKKSLISDVVTGGIFGLGAGSYVLALKALNEIITNGN